MQFITVHVGIIYLRKETTLTRNQRWIRETSQIGLVLAVAVDRLLMEENRGVGCGLRLWAAVERQRLLWVAAVGCGLRLWAAVEREVTSCGVRRRVRVWVRTWEVAEIK